MEKRRFGRRNHPSSSSSSSSSMAGSRGFRRAGKHEHEEEKEGEKCIVGTCPFMCPGGFSTRNLNDFIFLCFFIISRFPSTEEERLQRQRLRDLAVFERLNANPHQSSPALAVKKFCRTMSAQSVRASDVRPLSVLEETLNYLLELMDSREHPFEVVHDFVFDRTRSIRQDLTMQNIVHGKVVIHMYEKMVKFLVVSHHKLQGGCSGLSKSSMHHLNLEQLTKTLASLYNLYEVNRSSNSVYENEAEFHSLYVLLHLDCNGQPMGESLSLWFRNLPTPIVKSKEMCFARRVLRYFRMGNYRRFFCTTAAEASYLQYCIIEPYIDVVRALALACINNCGYKLHPYPLTHLSELLMMEESEVEFFCKSCGLETSMDEVGNKVLPTKQATFCCPKGGSQRYSFLGLEQFDRQIVVSTI